MLAAATDDVCAALPGRTRNRPSLRAGLALCRRVISGAGRLEVRPALEPVDFEATKRVRHAVYGLEKGFLEEGALLDPWDERGLVLNAWKGQKAIGTLRITDSAQGPLEIFDMHPELRALVRPGARLLELSRLMVLRRHRSLSVAVALFRRAILEMVSRRTDGLILSCAPKLIPYYRDVLGCRQLSREPLQHARLRGLVDYPMILDWPGVLERATPRTLPVWFAIHPAWCLRALWATGLASLLGPRSAP